MKAISLHQPWASLVGMGLKTWETRSWPTNHRGPLLICATKLVDLYAIGTLMPVRGVHPPHGIAIAVVDVIDCVPTESLNLATLGEAARYGDFRRGRWAWKLECPCSIEARNLPIRGRQGLFRVEFQDPRPASQRFWTCPPA